MKFFFQFFFHIYNQVGLLNKCYWKNFPWANKSKNKIFGQEPWIEKICKNNLLHGDIIPSLFQVCRLFAKQNLFQANILFPTIFSIKIRNLAIFYIQNASFSFFLLYSIT